MRRRNNAALLGFRALLGWLVLALAATACTTDTSDIGVGLPNAQVNTGAYLIDTLTVRASTVLRDSVITSASSYLLVGRTTDPLLGTLTAKSFFRVGLGAAFTPDGSYLYDSLTLVLQPDTYRYGDTTKTQALVEVHRLIDQISDTKPSYASTKYTRLNYDSTTVLNRGGVAPVRRARPNLTSLRLRLSDTFGRQLLASGQAGRITTQDELNAYLPGLVLTPAAADNAALLRLSATGSAALTLYYHDPADPATVLSTSFTLVAGNNHFFQVSADRRAAGVANLPTASLQAVSASRTGEQTFIEGALGLQTKLDFPYLTTLLEFGANSTVTSATLTALVPSGTLSPYVPTPPGIIVSYSDALNRPVQTYRSVSYLTGTSTVTGLEQGSYEWSILEYCQGVLAHTLPNNGLLLSPASAEVPNRVVLGSPANTTNKLQLRLYLIQVK